jgi:hypothetical protein
MTEALKLPPMARDGIGVPIEVRAEDAITRMTFAASSELPVERYFGEEVLSHEKSSIRLDRVTRGAMPLLFNHNWDDPIGVVDGARVEDGRLVVDAHLFETARAGEIAQMVKGGLRNVSLGYRIHVVEEDTKQHRYTATDWEPYAQQILEVLSAEPKLKNRALATHPELAGYAPKPHYRPLTKFENRGIKLGHGVWDVVFERT